MGCGSQKNTANSTNSTDKLLGTYQWVSSKYMTRGMKEVKLSNPETRGYSIVLEIKKTEIDIIKNDKKVATVPYKIIFSTDNQPIIQVQIPQDDFSFYIASGPFVIEGDITTIIGTYNDAGEDQTYKRLK